MIDDATILQIGATNSIDGRFTREFTELQFIAAARAIEQLARHEQREEDARICASIAKAEEPFAKVSYNRGRLIAAQECERGIRAAIFQPASGKENSNE